MRKVEIEKDNRSSFTLSYDETKYDIEYVKEKHALILRRLEDNQVLEIFSDDIGFIVQYDEEDTTNFIVTEYFSGKEGTDEACKLTHFYADKYDNSLNIKKQMNCNSIHYSEIHITDSSYVVDQRGYYGHIYNLKKRSKEYSHIYKDDNIRAYLHSLGYSNSILVEENLTAPYDHTVEDTITYGINPETFEATTPIWSEEQQRFIEIYDEKDFERVFGVPRNCTNWTNGDVTIRYEIENTLAELAEHLPKRKRVYTDLYDRKINEEFVKSFARN